MKKIERIPRAWKVVLLLGDSSGPNGSGRIYAQWPVAMVAAQTRQQAVEATKKDPRWAERLGTCFVPVAEDGQPDFGASQPLNADGMRVVAADVLPWSGRDAEWFRITAIDAKSFFGDAGARALAFG
jgi:hypothetical protein